MMRKALMWRGMVHNRLKWLVAAPLANGLLVGRMLCAAPHPHHCLSLTPPCVETPPAAPLSHLGGRRWRQGTGGADGAEGVGGGGRRRRREREPARLWSHARVLSERVGCIRLLLLLLLMMMLLVLVLRRGGGGGFTSVSQ